MATKLDKISEQFRKESLTRNSYSEKNLYNSQNPNALSNGDEKGKGQKGDNGTVGSTTDIQNRISSLGRNSYNENNKYGITSPYFWNIIPPHEDIFWYVNSDVVCCQIIELNIIGNKVLSLSTIFVPFTSDVSISKQCSKFVGKYLSSSVVII